ncbi:MULTISPECIES: adenylosuccinate synthetase [Providencia]|uniref:Adenylosuccinate synthetase n=2 Tax=Providencia stuartii TaxID=588 RepID=A0AAI9HZZ4_PROST|nr:MULTISPECIES: adenylosuccinate synthetase [Providencia]ELR5035764.1 adenylosuccinate synthetase [Providencia stuartii]ELR5046057.1 adenylosuccinate synthetase [Providencia rettgeri]ELR5290325.1 adenylosuccinate synthetase [Providencia stuartii]MCR4178715.1 adenylosuccinate synthetase [Providencia vermicola]URE79954.1 adenylosuccinate synthetase [Providencia stuartii]
MLYSVVGLQFGDEGKGKFVDYLAGKIKHIARFNGGANAGHCVQVKNQRLSFSQLPATLYQGNMYICQGALISLEILISEIERLKQIRQDISIYIDYRCHIVLPIHASLNQASEKFKGSRKIGSVGLGIGACFEDKANRHGIRLYDALDKIKLREKLAFLWDLREKQITYVFNDTLTLEFEDVVERLYEQCQYIKPYLAFTDKKIRQLLGDNKDVLLETSQATFLDNAFGSYPYTVAYQTLVQSCFSIIGIPASPIHVLGVMKAYMIRVGNGPFPTELHDDAAINIRERGNEYGTVSGRPRRCGWLDLNLIKQAIELNGVTELAITNVDVLANVDEIKIAINYMKKDKPITCEAALLNLSEVTPIYYTFRGWPQLKGNYHSRLELPVELRLFLSFIEEHTNKKIRYISYGADRDKTIICH